jgi:processing peptidase subunit alpha
MRPGRWLMAGSPAFGQSSSNRSVTDYALDMEKYVSNLACHMGRETLLYQAHFPAQNLSPVLSLVSDTMLHPLLTEHEVEESLFAASYELQLYDEKVDAYLMEVLQDVAFGGQALGRPNLPAVEAVNPDTYGDMPSLITAEGLRLFREKWFRPERIVISGTGMEHEALVELAEAQFGHLPYHPPSLSPSASSESLASLGSAASSSSSSSSSSVQTWFQSLLSAGSSSSSASSVASGSPPSSPSSGKSFATTSPPASSMLSLELPSVPPVGQPMTVYTGGVSIDVREEMDMAHVFVGCEGVDANSDDVVSRNLPSLVRRQANADFVLL